VGIVLGPESWIPRWVERVLTSAPFPESAALAAVLRMTGDAADRAGNLVVRLYAHFDRWRYATGTDACALVDPASLLSAIPSFEVGPAPAPGSQWPDLDVLLDFTGRAPVPLGEAAPLGMWVVEGEGQALDLHDAGLNEVLAGSPVVRLVLMARGNGAPQLLGESTLRTDLLSAHATRSDLLWQARHLISRALQSAAGGTGLPGGGRCHETSISASPGGTAWQVWQVARLAGRYAARQLSSRSRFEQWFLAYRFDHEDPLRCWGEFDYSAFIPLIPEPDRFWADPFAVTSDGRYFVFLEELLYEQRRGWISVMELGPDGPLGPPVPVIQEEHHLSYPFVFSHDGEWYMLPEAAQRRRIGLYRATRFPHEWVRDRALVEGEPFVDATLARIDGRWWLFAGRGRGPEHADNELHIFHAPSPLGPWSAHRLNPVLRDVSRSRPAGALFEVGGVWYRPVQDGSRSYGGALRLQRILRIDPDEYQEETVLGLAPPQGGNLVGMHTWNRSGNLTVIDGRRRRWKPLRRWGSSEQ
jgi:hypothetical protein